MNAPQSAPPHERQMTSLELSEIIPSPSSDHLPYITHKPDEQDDLDTPAHSDAAALLERSGFLPKSANGPLTPISFAGDNTSSPVSKTCEERRCDNSPGTSSDNPVVLDDPDEPPTAYPAKRRATSTLVLPAKKRRSSFFQQALAATAAYAKTPQAVTFAVVEQAESQEPATLLESRAADEKDATSVNPLKKRRIKAQKLEITAEERRISDEARKAALNLNAQQLAKQLEDAIPNVSDARFAEFAQLLKDSADPTVNTRDPHPEAAPLPSALETQGKKRSRKKKEDGNSEAPKKRRRCSKQDS